MTDLDYCIDCCEKINEEYFYHKEDGNYYCIGCWKVKLEKEMSEAFNDYDPWMDKPLNEEELKAIEEALDPNTPGEAF